MHYGSSSVWQCPEQSPRLKTGFMFDSDEPSTAGQNVWLQQLWKGYCCSSGLSHTGDNRCCENGCVGRSEMPWNKRELREKPLAPADSRRAEQDRPEKFAWIRGKPVSS